MKLQYVSDLHIEQLSNQRYLKRNPIRTMTNVIVLVGDIVPFKEYKHYEYFFKKLSCSFEIIFWVPGNHEYYGFDVTKNIQDQLPKNVHIVNNSTITINNCKIIFSTLWTKLSHENGFRIENYLNDFAVIKKEGQRFSISDYNQLHNESFKFIDNEIQNLYPQKTVVFTHHCPTFFNYPIQHKGHFANEAFAVELFDFIYDSRIDYWIHGHTHHQSSFEINATKILSNQLGYVQSGEYETFNPEAFIEL